MSKLPRREVFRWLGVSLALPTLLSTTLPTRAGAQTPPPKKRFVGCFFPSGAAMPGAANGDWTFEGALEPVARRGLRQNVALVRGYRAVMHGDVHWTGTAAFLSCNEVGVYTYAPPHPRAGERCGKSFDQYVADLENTKVRSLHGGWNTVPGWDESHDSQMSIRYVNSIAWRGEREPIQNTFDPQQMFVRVFGDGTSQADPQIKYLLSRRKSVLDGLHKQLGAYSRTLPPEDRTKVESYATGVREVETELSASLDMAASCERVEVHVEDPSVYLSRMRTMQKIIARAFQCNTTRAATLMYHEGIGDNAVHASVTSKQHDCAHNDWEKLKVINRLQMDLFAEFLLELKATGVLDETLVVLGSNMSDGRGHNAANIPFLVASEGPELRLGQEVIGTPDVTAYAQNRVLADIYVDLFKLYGINRPQFGEAKDRSTGKASGILT